MHYTSTRNNKESKSFTEVVFQGLAPDGGLYWPKSWPQITQNDFNKWQNLTYAELAFEVFCLFIDDIPPQDLRMLIDKAYEEFPEHDIAPLTKLDNNIWLLELFHGPTLSFKDFALKALGQILDYLCQKHNVHKTIIVATSGDTGSAALHAFKGSQNIDIVVLHPYERISDMQRRQMTTISSPNALNIALKGTFDDCQNIVKSLFQDKEFTNKKSLTAVNSINWCRVLAQIVYYIYTCLRLTDYSKKISFAVPTGNFGNILAGYCAKKMGLPIDKLIICSNENDVLPRFFEHNKMSLQNVVITHSPSMDIQISSNFERFIFDISENSQYVSQLMSDLKTKHNFSLSPELWKIANMHFVTHTCDNNQTLKTIHSVFTETYHIIDPHTAVAVHAIKCVASGQNLRPIVALSTASPGKFFETVEKAIEKDLILPKKLASLKKKQEYYEILPNKLGKIKEKIQTHFKDRHDT